MMIYGDDVVIIYNLWNHINNIISRDNMTDAEEIFYSGINEDLDVD